MEEYPKINKVFMEENGIKLMQFGVAGNKVKRTSNPLLSLLPLNYP
jgi:hypothetical protein